MAKVKSITEAFSMQPNAFSVCDINPSHHDHDKDCLIEIRLESIRIDGNPYDVYSGYNFAGQRTFQYFANTVNVTYYYE
jgi:hypothetical protein